MEPKKIGGHGKIEWELTATREGDEQTNQVKVYGSVSEGTNARHVQSTDNKRNFTLEFRSSPTVRNVVAQQGTDTTRMTG